MEMDLAAAADLGAVHAAWQTLKVDWELTEGEVDALLPAGGSERGRPPMDTERRMRLLIEVNNRALLELSDLRDVLRLASPALGWLTPIEAMSGGLGDLRRVRAYAERGLLR